jgi:hypothetical protein
MPPKHFQVMTANLTLLTVPLHHVSIVVSSPKELAHSLPDIKAEMERGTKASN